MPKGQTSQGEYGTEITARGRRVPAVTSCTASGFMMAHIQLTLCNLNGFFRYAYLLYISYIGIKIKFNPGIAIVELWFAMCHLFVACNSCFVNG